MQFGLLFFADFKIRMLTAFSKNLENWPIGAAVIHVNKQI